LHFGNNAIQQLDELSIFGCPGHWRNGNQSLPLIQTCQRFEPNHPGIGSDSAVCPDVPGIQHWHHPSRTVGFCHSDLPSKVSKCIVNARMQKTSFSR
jgi:hypothetical protein